MSDVTHLMQVHDRLVSVIKPSRELDLAIARTLSSQMLWRGRPLGIRHMSMAFTRGVENAERFILIALPDWEWTVGSNFKGKGCTYYANLWGPHDEHDDAGGATPALALLICAFACGIEEGGWPALSTFRASEEDR